MSENRKPIGLDTTLMDTLVIMSEGNPGALRVIMDLCKSVKDFFLILGLDDMNIRGWQIWVGYKDFCKSDMNKFIECIKNRDSDMVNTINREATMMKVDTRAVCSGASFR